MKKENSLLCRILSCPSLLRLYKEKSVGIDLSSRYVAVQVFSAPHSLTSVFGMGTGGPCAIITPTAVPADATFGGV